MSNSESPPILQIFQVWRGMSAGVPRDFVGLAAARKIGHDTRAVGY